MGLFDSEIFNRPCFYFKLIEWVLAAASTIVYFTDFSFHYTPDPSIKTLIAITVPNSLVNLSTLIVMWVVDQKNEVFEFSCIASDGALYISVGTILLCNLSHKANTFYTAMTALCICNGIVFLIDTVALIKSLENDKKD